MSKQAIGRRKLGRTNVSVTEIGLGTAPLGDLFVKVEDDEAAAKSHHGVFIASAIGFFLAEMGDRTQIATAVLAARYQPLWQVVAGTTLGMLAANVPVVFLGARFAHRLPLRATRITACLLFAILGAVVLLTG